MATYSAATSPLRPIFNATRFHSSFLPGKSQHFDIIRGLETGVSQCTTEMSGLAPRSLPAAKGFHPMEGHFVLVCSVGEDPLLREVGSDLEAQGH